MTLGEKNNELQYADFSHGRTMYENSMSQVDSIDKMHDKLTSTLNDQLKQTTGLSMGEHLYGKEKEYSIDNALGISKDDIKKIMKDFVFKKPVCQTEACRQTQEEALLRTKHGQAVQAYNKAKSNLDKIMKEKQKTPAYQREYANKQLVEGEVKMANKIEEHATLKYLIQERIDYLEQQREYDKNVKNLLEVYEEKSVEMTEQLIEAENQNNINDRKSYYEDQQISGYKKINNTLSWIYWILVALLICIELYKYAYGTLQGNYNIYAGYSIFMILYPFIMNYISSGLQ